MSEHGKTTGEHYTYNARLLDCAVKLAKERCFKLSSCVICRLVTLQYLVDPFEQKGPEAVKRPKILHALLYVSAVMVIGAYDIRTV